MNPFCQRILLPALTSVIAVMVGPQVTAQAQPQPQPQPQGQLSDQPGYILGEFLYADQARPTPSCHASTIAEVTTPRAQSRLAAAWFGGTFEGHSDVAIWLATKDMGASSWSAPRLIADGVQHTTKRYPCWNPVLHQEPGPEGPLLLFYKVGPNPSQWWGMLTISRDGGMTWSVPRRLPEEVLGPVKNKPLRLADGTLLCPSSSEHNGWRVHMERTTDQGVTWSHSGPLHDGKAIAAIQPSLLVHRDGRLQALGRTRQRRLFQVWSSDQGKTWGEVTLMSLPNPNSGTDAVTLPDGRHALVYNPTEQGRTPLVVAISQDGQAWKTQWSLETQPGEYSYPAVIVTSDNKLHITYTWKRQLIKHVILDPTQAPAFAP